MNSQSPGPEAKAIDPFHLMLDSSGIVLVVLLILIVASAVVWVIWILKALQLGRLRHSNLLFEKNAETIETGSDLISLALQHRDSPGARVVIELAKRHHQRTVNADLLGAVAKRAIAAEQQKASKLMPTLSSIASASPFVGLFGTVWGIMDAFLRIGLEKSASLPVVAPAIGEALIATAFGLVAAIPATVAFNFIDKRIGDLLEELSASSEAWVHTLVGDPGARGAGMARPESHRPGAVGYRGGV
jgi:biopolymer transport protein TolQ